MTNRWYPASEDSWYGSCHVEPTTAFMWTASRQGIEPATDTSLGYHDNGHSRRSWSHPPHLASACDGRPAKLFPGIPGNGRWPQGWCHTYKGCAYAFNSIQEFME